MRRTSRRRPSRDVAPRGRVSEPRSLARYRREVVALLMVGHGLRSQQALRLVKKWDRYVKARRLEGRPPCNVADHLAKFERQKLVRPAPGRSQGKRFSLSRSAFRKQMRPVRTHRRGRARDADAPEKGDVYETRAGNRWEVTGVTDKLVTVKRAGNRSEGPFAWGRSTLKGMKEVKKPFFGPIFAGKKSEPVILPDPDRGSRKLTRKRRTNSGYPIRRCPRGTRVQTLVFERKHWTLTKAKSWAKSHGYRVVKVDSTDRYIRLRQLSPTSYRTVGSMPFKRGLTAVLGCPR